MNYTKEIKEERVVIRKTKFKLMVMIFMAVSLTTAFVTAMIFSDKIRSTAFMASSYFAVALMVFLHSISSFMQDIKYHKQRILRLKDKQEAENALGIKSAQFNEVYDGIIKEIRDRQTFNSHYKHKLTEMIPSKDVRPWEPHPDFNNRILGYWKEDDKQYVITCPAQLRDKLIDLQNNLGNMLG